MFIIQVYKKEVKRFIDEVADGLLARAISQAKWHNLERAYNTYEEAYNVAVGLLENGRYSAADVRIIEVVAQFKATVVVDAQNAKYPTPLVREVEEEVEEAKDEPNSYEI